MNGFSNDAPDAYSPLKGKKVLIADRHTSTRMALRDMVNQLGVTNVLNAGSAGDVIRIVKQQYVDIILCEYLLDEVRDGQQLLEELRHEKLIPLHTMFMIITNERSYQQVVAVAEFAPDDYLLKPFTPSALNDRLLRANLKKQIFAAAYSAMEKGKTDDALNECDQAMQLQPKFAMDAIRLKIDILTTVGRIEEAEKLLEKVLLNKATPWAKMGLAQVRYKQDRLSEAEQICENIIAEKGEFLAAYDFLAKVKQDLGKDDEALAVLERASGYSSFNVRRLRATADVAKKTGDLEKAGRIYNKVIDRVRDSSLIRSDDFAKLSKVYVEQGKFDEAEKVSVELRRTLKGTPEVEIVSKMAEFERYKSQNEHAKSKAALDAALKAYKSQDSTIDTNVEADLAEMCFRNGLADEGFQLARKIAVRPGIERGILNRIRTLLGEHRKMQEEARSKNRVVLAMDDIYTYLARLDQDGWNEALGTQCENSLAYWERSDAGNPQLEGAQMRLSHIMRKYGISSKAEQIDLGGLIAPAGLGASVNVKG